MIRQIQRLAWHPNARLALLATHRPCSTLDLNQSTGQTNRTKSAKSAEQWPEDSERELTGGVKEISESANSVQRTGARNSSELARRSVVAPNDSSTGKKLKAHLNQTLRKVKSKEHLKSVLGSLWPVLKRLEPRQLGVAFEVFSDLPSALNRARTVSSWDSRWILQSSQSLELLLNRGNSHINELNPHSLSALLKLLVKIGRMPDDEIVRNTIEQLNARLDELNLGQLSEVLASVDYYAEKFATRKLVKFRTTLLERLRVRILNSTELEAQNVDQLVPLFHRFLMNCESDENFEIVKHLLEMLQSPDVQLNFDQSVSLLSSVRMACRELPEPVDRKSFYPTGLARLIDECNSSVYEQLESKSKAHHYRFLEEVYRTRSWFTQYFPNFCDPWLLDRLAAFFAGDRDAIQGNLRLEHALQIRNLVFCYSKVGLYNEQLIKLLYRLVCNETFPANEFTPVEYHLLASYRWPFVDHQRLLNALKSSKKFLDVRASASTYSGILCQLILHEANDRELLQHLNENARPFVVKDFQFYLDNYKQTTLARAVLEMFCNLNDKDLQLDLKRTLDKRLRELSQSLYMPRVLSNSMRIDSRLQEAGYLSNGVLVDLFAIHDRSIGDLIPLNRFKEQFKRIDSIQLTHQQELLGLIRCTSFRGDVASHELNYDYQLRRVLQAFKLKTIDISISDLVALETMKERVQFLIEKALESYK